MMSDQREWDNREQTFNSVTWVGSGSRLESNVRISLGLWDTLSTTNLDKIHRAIIESQLSLSKQIDEILSS